MNLPHQIKALPHVKVKAINADLLRWVEVSKGTAISGNALYIVYQHHGLESPFDIEKSYRIYSKEGGHCLVVENTEVVAA